MPPLSNCFHDFHRPRLVGHLHPHCESCIYSRFPISTWKDPKPDLKQRLRRTLSGRRRQGLPSPPGFGKLPYELLDVIFRRLCGKEVAAIRLVSTEYEFASRPFFAQLHLVKSVFWITGSQLDILDSLTRKFGEYMQGLYIAADEFTVSGLLQALERYLSYRYSHVVARRYCDDGEGHWNCSKSMLEIKSTYIGQWFKKKEWRTYCDTAGSRRFFWHYATNIVSLRYLRMTGKDINRLQSVMDRLPNCEVKVVSLSYEAYQLNINVSIYGKAAPAHAFELALYCSKGNTSDAKSCEHAQTVLEEALTRRRLLSSPSS